MFGFLALGLVATVLGAPSKRLSVAERLALMTVEEKVGQMTQLDIDLFVGLVDPQNLDEEKVRYAARNLKIGSILNSPAAGRANGIWSSAKFREVIATIQRIFQEEGVLPVLYGIDSVHGANYISDATLFPQQINVGATFNRTISELAGSVTAKDTRAASIPWNFGPILDLAINKQWARHWETFGEDPFLVSELGVANIIGQQGFPRNLRSNVKVAASAKHFIGYGTQKGGDRSAIWIPDRQLLDYYVPSFDAALNRAMCATVMESYNEINGVPVVLSRQYLIDLLRNQLQFPGVLVTDWSEINHAVHFHRAAPTYKDSVRVAMQETSIDLSMVPLLAPLWYDNLVELVNEGVVNETRLDESVTRILELKEELGLFDENPEKISESVLKSVGSAEDRELALAAARESIVVVKNSNGFLPLSPVLLSSVLVTGPTSNSIRFQNGGWTIHHQGAYNEDEFEYGTTVLEGVRLVTSGVNVVHEPGCAIEGPCDPAELAAAVEAARSVDVAIVCVGESTYAEKPGDIFDLSLSSGQLDLVRQIASTGTRVVLVLLEGRPRLLGDIVELSESVVLGMLPSNDGGLAIAEIIFGIVNPSGRMSFSYPSENGESSIPYFHKYSEADSYAPLWPFGHGLSYTTFEYSDLTVVPAVVRPGDSFTISVTVRNSGQRSGQHAVLAFVSDLYRSVTPEVKMLKAFTKIELAPGASQRVSFPLTTDALSFYGIDLTRQIEVGEFTITVDSLTAPLTLEPSSSEGPSVIALSASFGRALAGLPDATSVLNNSSVSMVASFLAGALVALVAVAVARR